MIPRECVVALRRRPITQASVDAPVVVVVDIVNNRYLGVREGSKLMASKAFVLEDGAERLNMGVLIWGAQRDVFALELVLVTRCQPSPAGELWAVLDVRLPHLGNGDDLTVAARASECWTTPPTLEKQDSHPLQRRYTRFLLITSQCSRRNQ